MTYQELIEKAMKRRTVSELARQWEISQPTLHRYLKGGRLPDFTTACKMIEDAGVDPIEGLQAIANEEKINKVKNFKLQMGFVQNELATILALKSLLLVFILCQMVRVFTREILRSFCALFEVTALHTSTKTMAPEFIPIASFTHT